MRISGFIHCRLGAWAVLGMLLVSAHAADVRDRTRLADLPVAGLTQTQSSDITLTSTDVSPRPIQTWIRTAGTLDGPAKTVTASLSASDAEKVRVGQRVRAFAVNARTRMHQGRVSAVTAGPRETRVVATLAGDVDAGGAARYLLEIVTEQGPYLSIPNVSIIDDGGKRVVYLERANGEYVRREIRTGLEGELYTQVFEGLKVGDAVVSTGSFFVDAEQKLSVAGAAAMYGICSSTPGMAYSALDTSKLNRKSRMLGSQGQVSKLLDGRK